MPIDDAGRPVGHLGQHGPSRPPRPANRSPARPGCRPGRRRARPRGRAHRAARRCCGGAARRAPRSGPAGPPARRRRRPAASRVPRTRVLPEPTSPCSSRCMGCARARSAAISSPTLPLPVGQLVGQARVERGQQPGVRARPGCAGRQRPPAAGAAPASAVRRTPRPTSAGAWRRYSSSLERRPVDLAQRRAEADQVAAGAHRGRQRVLRRLERVQHGPHAPGDHPGRHGRRGRVDRDQRPGELLDLLGRLVLSWRPRRAAGTSGPLSCRLPRNSVTLPANSPHRPGFSSRSRHAWLKKVQVSVAPEPSPTVISSMLPLRARIGRTVVALHLGQHRDLLTDLQLAHVGVLAALVVAAREVVDQVAGGVQVEVARRAPWRSCRRAPCSAGCRSWWRSSPRSLDSYQEVVAGLAARIALHLDERPPWASAGAASPPGRRGVGAEHQRGQLAAAAEHPVEQAAADVLEVGADHVHLAVDQAEQVAGAAPARPRSARRGCAVQTSPYRQAPAASAIAITSSVNGRAGSRTASAASACTGDRVGTTLTRTPVAGGLPGRRRWRPRGCWRRWAAAPPSPAPVARTASSTSAVDGLRPTTVAPSAVEQRGETVARRHRRTAARGARYDGGATAVPTVPCRAPGRADSAASPRCGAAGPPPPRPRWRGRCRRPCTCTFQVGGSPSPVPDDRPASRRARPSVARSSSTASGSASSRYCTSYAKAARRSPRCGGRCGAGAITGGASAVRGRRR